MTATIREQLTSADGAAVRAILESSGFFVAEEIDMAVWQVEDRLARGAGSEYCYFFAEHGGGPVAYTCYGRILGTVSSYDLFWIAVHGAHRHHGLGRHLLEITERRIAAEGGRRIYAETSSRALYAPTRRFYELAGYNVEARLADYYAPGDDKLVYVSKIG